MPKSTYLANKVVDHVFGKTVYTAPATLYLALFSVTPNVGGGGTEFTGGGYARVAVTNNTTNFPNGVSGGKAIGADITFPVLTADHPDAVAFGIFDDVSAGNLLAFGDISPTKECLAADIPYFPTGALTFTES